MKWFWIGAVLTIAAIMLDTHWHASTGLPEAGIPPYHYIWMLAIGTMVFGAIRVRKAGKSPIWAMNLFVLATFIAAAGSIWDNFGNHIFGIEPGMFDPPHVTLNGGSLLAMICALLTFILQKKDSSKRAKTYAG
jgi:peptidoglycan/LPS O-acetylase OafA/YrhL